MQKWIYIALIKKRSKIVFLVLLIFSLFIINVNYFSNHQDHVILPSSLTLTTTTNTKPYACNKTISKTNSQYSQDVELQNLYFKGLCGGFFLEIGAADGTIFSNTFRYEKDLNWSGVLIEASPKEAKKLLANKERGNSIKVNSVIGDREDTLTWIDLTGDLEVISAVKELSAPSHLKRIEKELKRYPNETKSEIPVKMTKLSTILQQNNVKHIHFFSLDVEGAELSVLQSIDFSKVNIDLFLIEVERRKEGEEKITNFLKEKGYFISHRFPIDVVYCKTSFCLL